MLLGEGTANGGNNLRRELKVKISNSQLLSTETFGFLNLSEDYVYSVIYPRTYTRAIEGDLVSIRFQFFSYTDISPRGLSSGHRVFPLC
jgi:hypothetical protein